MLHIKHLRQRIFLYTFLLILFANIIGFIAFHFALGSYETRKMVERITSDIAASMTGKEIEITEPLLAVFQRSSNQFWTEDVTGKVLTGQPVPGFERERRSSYPTTCIAESDALIMETDLPKAEFIAKIPIALEDTQAFMFLAFGKPPPPPILPIFFQGLISVTIVGGCLSFVVATRISIPLKRLREEVLSIASGALDKRVAVKGYDEIAEVASSINALAGNLQQIILGMRELMANASHELRSPLARMSVSVAILEEEIKTFAKQEPDTSAQARMTFKHLHNLQTEIDHLEALIGTSLLSSKLDLQKDIPMSPVDFSGLCSEMANRHSALMHSHGFLFQQRIELGATIMGDEGLLCQLVSNLLDNAAKYTTKNGKVIFRMVTNKTHAILTVENSHTPLPTEVLRSIFAPFYRGGLATGDNEGVGLGLALVKKIAEVHNATITAENSDLGVLFTFTLALCSKDRSQPSST